MPVTIAKDWHSGSSDKHSSSCVGVAGSGLPSAFYECQGRIQMRQNDDGSIDMNMASFQCWQYAISNSDTSGNWNSNDWTFHGLYVSRSPFTLYDGPGGVSGYGSGAQAWSGGTIWHDRSGSATSHYTELIDSWSNGWFRIANNINELEHEADLRTVYVYAGGLIDFVSTPTSDISIEAARIPIAAFATPVGPGPEVFYKYYPWERLINGSWYSLNREGGSSTNAGLFRLAGSWQPLTNSVGGSNGAHAFRHVNGWQMSPKSGLGA